MRLRSLLYVPANSARFVAKAHKRGADAIILDLEDAVPEQEKDAARNSLPASVASARQEGAVVFVRANAGPRQHDDALSACEAGADGLVLAKVSRSEIIDEVAGWLATCEAGLQRNPMSFIPLLEDAASLHDAPVIARAHRVVGLALGGEDLALDIGAAPVPEVLRFPKLVVHYAAKAARKLSLGLLQSIADFSDLDRIAHAADEARMHGFDGATCIHPSAIPIFNRCFGPSEAEMMWARRVLAAAQTAVGPFVMDGRMVDAPVIARARAILSR